MFLTFEVFVFWAYSVLVYFVRVYEKAVIISLWLASYERILILRYTYFDLLVI